MAQTIHSQAGGDWYAPATWVGGIVPGATNDVVIHHLVTYSGAMPNVTAQANSVLIINDGLVEPGLRPSGGTLTIGAGGLTITGTSASLSCLYRSSGNANCIINGNVSITSGQQGNFSSRLILDATSSLTVNGNFVYMANATDAVAENITEIGTNNASQITVNGDFSITYNSSTKNSVIAMLLEGSSDITITGNLSLINLECGTVSSPRITVSLGASVNPSDCSLTINGSVNLNNDDTTAPRSNTLAVSSTRDAVINIGGDINFNYLPTVARANANRIRVALNSRLNLAGNINFVSNAGGTINNRLDIENMASFDFKGNVNNSGRGFITSSASAMFLFTGTIAQTLPIVLPNYANITLNNTSGSLVTLEGNVSVSGTLTMTRGIIDPVSPDRLNFFSAGTTTVGNLNSYIVNGATKIGSSPALIAVGDGVHWAPVSFSNITGASEFFTAFSVSYSHAAPTDFDTDGTFDHISGIEYWNVSVVSAPGTGQPPTPPTSADVTFYWKDACSSEIHETSIVPQDLYIARYNTVLSQWNRLPTIIDPASEPCGVGSETGNVTVSLGNLVTDYTQFTFAAINPSNNPLPVELEYFEAKLNNSYVELTWNTLSELNNEKFIVQKSQNGFEWSSIYQTAGLGTSSVGKKYEFNDYSLTLGRSYYRLIQQDFDNQTTYSNVKYVDVEELQDNRASLYPNPFKNKLSLTSPQKNGNIKVEVYSLKGVLVKSTNLTNSFTVNELDMSKLPPGNYIVVIIDATGKLIHCSRVQKME